jgi:uncharacterized membrane protein (UPF0127 family)
VHAKNANPVSAAWAAVLVLALASGCGRGADATAVAARRSVFDRFTIAVAGRPASLHVAVLDPEQERGLMQRPDLAGDEGMVFVNKSPKALSFWMRNTPEPLDLAYLSPEGEVREVYALLPLDERPVCSADTRLQFALEMRRGWFAENGVHPGTRIDLSALASALRDRGFDPADYGLK